MTGASCLACDVAERAAIEGHPLPSHALAGCTCDKASRGIFKHPMALTVFGPTRWRASTPRGVLVRETFGGLVRWAQHPIVTDDKSEPGGFSFATFSGDVRALANVLEVSALALDVDHGNVTPTDLHEALGRFGHLVYSTHSDAPKARRSRVVLPFDRPASRAEYEVIWPAARHIFEAAGVPLDPSTRDASRFWFAPAIRPGAVFECFAGRGEFLSVGRLLEVARVVTTRQTARSAPVPTFRATGDSSRSLVARAAAYVSKMPAAISGSGGHLATFAVARKLVADFRLSEGDAWSVLLEFNARCEPPWSEKQLRHKLAQARRARVSNPVDGATP